MDEDTLRKGRTALAWARTAVTSTDDILTKWMETGRVSHMDDAWQKLRNDLTGSDPEVAALNAALEDDGRPADVLAKARQAVEWADAAVRRADDMLTRWIATGRVDHLEDEWYSLADALAGSRPRFEEIEAGLSASADTAVDPWTSITAPLRWEPVMRGATGYSGIVSIGMVGPKGREWFHAIDGITPDDLVPRMGMHATCEQAKAAVEGAWGRWLRQAGVAPEADAPTPAGSVAGVGGTNRADDTAEDTPLAASLRRACAMYNDRPLRALRAEDPQLCEDGVTVVSDGVGYEPESVRDMLGWLAAGQWDADGPDPSVGDDELVRPAHARLASWWRSRNRT